MASGQRRFNRIHLDGQADRATTNHGGHPSFPRRLPPEPHPQENPVPSGRRRDLPHCLWPRQCLLVAGPEALRRTASRVLLGRTLSSHLPPVLGVRNRPSAYPAARVGCFHRRARQKSTESQSDGSRVGLSRWRRICGDFFEPLEHGRGVGDADKVQQ